MRKRNFDFCLDRLMWFLIYTFPIWIVLFNAFITPLGDILTTITECSFVVDFVNTDVYSVLNDIFGERGLIPMFMGDTGSAVLSYMTYFVYVLLIHLAVDFLVFIPRIAHNLLSKVGGGKSE